MRKLATTLIGRSGLLVFALAVSAGVALPLAARTTGADGLTTASVACLVCLLSGLMAQLVAYPFRHPDQALLRLAVSMPLRTGLPLLACMLIYLAGGRLAEAGFVFYLLAFYFVMLAVETGLMLVESPSASGGKLRAQEG